MNADDKLPVCIYCGNDVVYDDYFEEWQHLYSGDPQCKDDNGNFMASAALPKKI